MQQYDILIIGGGLVGATLVRALHGRGLRIAVVEAVQFETRTEAGYDDRAIALAYGTRRIFEGLGLWDELVEDAAPIHRIHVSDRGHCGFTRMDRDEEGLPALGYVVPARVLGRVLGEAAHSVEGADFYCPATLENLGIEKDRAGASVLRDDDTLLLAARLVVAADGAGSAVRERLGIPAIERDYGQTAIIANITPQLPHRHVAYERFTDSGPMAVLPMTADRCAVVWTVDSRTTGDIMELSDDAFLSRLQERFGYRLGRFERVGRRQAYPLRLVKAEESVRHRLGLVGNAAHTLHPIAGQGFNLGVRDVAVLAEVLVDALAEGRDPGEPGVLNRYDEWRRADQQRVTAFTDGLARLFTLPIPGLGMARAAGMVALDLLPPAKRLLTRVTMGRAGRIPRLARGLPL
jgi:2-octaprenyl-6-methoxyphenol hydroxylase